MKFLMSAISGLVLAAGCNLAFAAPDKEISWLMNAPITLMDWGIKELGPRLNWSMISDDPASDITKEWREKYKNDLASRHLRTEAFNARYEWDQNRIIIGVFADRTDKQQPSPDDCLYVLNQTRHRILRGYVAHDADIISKENRVESGTTFLSEVFRHPAGYEDKGKPAELYKHLTEITMFRVSVSRGDDNLLRNVRCHGSFTGDDVSLEMKTPIGLGVTRQKLEDTIKNIEDVLNPKKN